MAITLQSASLMQPHGELDCDFFASGDLNAKIGGWLSQAKSKVLANSSIREENQNEAARQWTYYLAYDYLAGKIGSQPNSVSVNNGADSISYGQDRLSHWNVKASRALAAYNALISNVATVKSDYTGPIQFKAVM